MSQLESTTTENIADQYHDDVDEDDDHAQSAHKVAPSRPLSAASGTLVNNNSTAQTGSSADAHTRKPVFVQCNIKRDKGGLAKGFATSFCLYYDGASDNNQQPALYARKHRTIGGHVEYYIGTDMESLSKNVTNENVIAKLRGDLTNTEYILYDVRNSPSNERLQPQMAAIIYDAKLFGSKEPRKFTVLLQDTGKNNSSMKEGETIIDGWRTKVLPVGSVLRNRTPIYDEESKSFTLNMFANRIEEASHKNFQVVPIDGDDDEHVLMQFGRVDENMFALDYREPLTPIQAFAIALTSFQGQLHA